jgi:Domain of Unknown Function (DUF1080)
LETGYEIQIDEEARFQRARWRFLQSHRSHLQNQATGPLPGSGYNNNNQRLAAGQWHQYEIEVSGQETTRFTRSNTDTLRGNLPSIDADSGFIGLQTHTDRVAFANVRVKRFEG